MQASSLPIYTVSQKTRSQAVARIADRTASQHLWSHVMTSRDLLIPRRPFLILVVLWNQASVFNGFRDGLQSFPGWLLSRMVFSRKDVSRKVDSRIVIFPDRTFPGKTIPGWPLSRKDVSRVVIFPDETISYD